MIEDVLSHLTTEADALMLDLFPTNRQMLLARTYFGDLGWSPLAERTPSLLQ